MCPDAGRHVLRRAVDEVAERAADLPLAETVGVDRPGCRMVGALDHVAAIGVDLVGEVAGDDRPVGLGVLAHPPLDAARHPRHVGVVTAVGQTVAVGLDERRVDAQQPLAELPGSVGALRTLVAHPDRQAVLQRPWRDDAVVPEAAHLTRPIVGVGVAAGEVGAVELELGDSVPGAEPELEPAAWLMMSTTAACSASSTGWWSGATTIAVPMRGTRVRAATAAAIVSGWDR